MSVTHISPPWELVAEVWLQTLSLTRVTPSSLSPSPLSQLGAEVLVMDPV